MKTINTISEKQQSICALVHSSTQAYYSTRKLHLRLEYTYSKMLIPSQNDLPRSSCNQRPGGKISASSVSVKYEIKVETTRLSIDV